MQSRFDTEVTRDGGRSFIPFSVIGYPSAEASLNIIKAMIDGGASALELGLAFSDPMADGPIIEEAARQVVASGFTTDDAFALLRELRKTDEKTPIVLMTYFNLVLARGVEAFFKTMQEVGVDGITIVDLPVEEAEDVLPIAAKYGIAPVMLISPLTDDARLSKILNYAKGYLYLVSRAGITGLEQNYDQKISEIVERIRSQSELPLCIGFGISTPEQGENMINCGADGVIVGSKIIDIIEKSTRESVEQNVRQFVQAMVEGVSRAEVRSNAAT